MKKYYQAALALTAALSLIALLFYRHEYNKLRFVLQVFNYFGTPSQNPANESCSISTSKFRSDFSEPSATWQRLSDDLHVFSAYHIDEEVRAIAFGSTDYLKNNVLTCAISTNAENPRRIVGNFAYEITSENDSIDVAYVNGRKFYGLVLLCNGANVSKHEKITGVQFSGGEKSKAIIKVRRIAETGNKNDSVICVAPPNLNNDEPLGKRMDMISFIAFHRNIGLDNFIVYDFGIPDVFNVAMKSLSGVLNMNFTYSTVAWNFPYEGVDYKVIRHLVESDCLYRTFGRAKLAVTLTWNEYINLKYHWTLSNVISDFNKAAGGSMSGDPFGVETFVFCVDGSSGDSLNFSTPMILSTTKRLRGQANKEDRHIYELEDKGKVFRKRNFRRKLDDLVEVYKYEGCGGDQEVVENQVLRFAENTPGSTVFQYYITGGLFSD
ncbi:uncharacterized protein LOC135165570 [Diachasmimorpha longicaudata]|uniref:uncharacterized protein LOC135165570 n=1 Tax=Diachasmimorpha longicaudata TaxID=58733 RepID=UPI0030B90A2A